MCSLYFGYGNIIKLIFQYLYSKLSIFCVDYLSLFIDIGNSTNGEFIRIISYKNKESPNFLDRKFPLKSPSIFKIGIACMLTRKELKPRARQTSAWGNTNNLLLTSAAGANIMALHERVICNNTHKGSSLAKWNWPIAACARLIPKHYGQRPTQHQRRGVYYGTCGAVSLCVIFAPVPKLMAL